MKLAEVEIGGRYWIRVNSRQGKVMTIVTVTRKWKIESAVTMSNRTRFTGINARTGKELRFTAAKLRGKVSDDQYTRFLSEGSPFFGSQ